MKTYESDKIRNIAVLGHSGCGKSNLIEAVLYTNKVVNRISKPNEEVNMTSTLNLVPVEWNDHKYNFLDTPGYFDFYGESISAIKAAAGSIIVVDGTCDIQVGTDKALEITDENNTPKFIFINKIDSSKAKYNKVLDQLRERYGKKIAPFHLPIGNDEEFKGFINVVDMFAREYNGKDCVTVDIPEDVKEEISPIREMLLESVAETDDELLDKYFSQEEFTQDEIHRGLRKGVLKGNIIPVLCGSTNKNIGIHTLLDMIWDYMPSPVDIGISSDNKEFSGVVFKTLVDPFVGKISLLKVCEGELTPDTEVYNINKENKEKIYHIYSLNNKDQIELKKAVAGDIVVLNKLLNVQTGDTLSTSSKTEPFENIEFPKPQIYYAIDSLKKGDEEKISNGLHKLSEEDLSFKWFRNHETKQTLIGGQGELHINFIKDKLKEKFGVDVKLSDLKVAYRETIKGKSDVQGKHKKQSGGHGQYGDVKIKFEPSEEEFIFEEAVFGGSVPRQYIPAVEKGIKESLSQGALAGFPVMNIKATLYDGSYHDVDSSEMAFKIASSIAFKKGIQEATPVLLEPIMNLKIVVPEEYMGDVMGDINKRRGKILGMEPSTRGKQVIYAHAPQAETFKYAIDLRSMTQGRGYFEMEFDKYCEVPSQFADKIIEEARNNK